MTESGGNLIGFVPLSNEERDDVIQLSEEDIKGTIHNCINSLVERLFANKSFSTEIMDGALKAIWGRPVEFRVKEIDHNQFQFFFDNEWDIMRIERGSSWLFKDYALHVQHWKEGMYIGEQPINEIPIWAQF
ncbi:uncharacterized protein [Arachis hypogaea]|uniref:uncharacterized protein n=1 Tax=Arachis hypogaea TaxID=3818 RepID=UPI003B2158CA